MLCRPRIGQVAAEAREVRPAAERAGVPYTTARGWVRRFTARAPQIGAGFAALAVELGGQLDHRQAGRVAELAGRCGFSGSAAAEDHHEDAASGTVSDVARKVSLCAFIAFVAFLLIGVSAPGR
jgi:hypothetical protein